MLRLALESGTTDIVATPHANPHFRFDPQIVAAHACALREAAGPNAPRVHTGCDFHLTFENIERALSNRERYTVNGGRYLLVEFPDLAIFPSTSDTFARMLGAGIVPIITHPERNELLQKRLPDLRAWAEMGCLLQVTASALLGRFGKRAESCSHRLMDADLVHCIASDAHDTVHRPPGLAEARQFVDMRWGARRGRRLFEQIPRAVIENLDLPDHADPEPRRWYQFWR
jgi:protein-tyrosine phosphatase